VPTEHLTDPDVWAALLPHMGLEALVRNLGNLSKCGLLSPLSVGERAVADRLADEAQIRRSRLHPVRILVGLLIYQSGHGQRGKGTWPVSPRAVEALDGAFYKAFKNVEPSGKRIMMACDVSGSMNAPNLMGVPGLTPMVVGAAMAMVTVKTEPNVFLVAFSHQLTPTDLGRCNRLDDVVRTLSRIPMGGTDCALPMLAAAQNKIPVDTFAMYTDNESWAGRVHVPEALKQYRKQEGIDARFVVAAMTATEYSVVDPADPGSLAIVGFDIEAPALMSDFAAGRI
jgi:60 kDa SS-A/Ro ribonucleoprotein